MRIAITTMSSPGQNIWSSGITQNALFVARLLRNIPFVRDVVLLDAGTEQDLGPQVDLGQFGTRLLKRAQVQDQVDVIVEFAGAMDPGWLDLQRARGKKVIWYCAGNPYAGLVESSIFREQAVFHRTERHDAIWILPEHAHARMVLETLYRAPVTCVPYLWDPCFVRMRVEELQRHGLSFGYAPDHAREAAERGAGWNVAVFEPNISPIKCGLIPMLVAEESYRSDPASVRQLFMLNMEHLATHPTLLYMANSLDLVRAHKASFLGRHDIAGFMSEHRIDAVISHQWTNDQNYLYLDVLFGNYPLIHNSPWLKEAGYYYPDFETKAGAAALLEARSRHAQAPEEYARRAAGYFHAVGIHNPDNVQRYAGLLKEVCHDRPQWWEGA